MPISRKVFERGNFRKKYEDRTKHPVTLLLKSNKNLAFTVKEIVKRVKMKPETVRSTLRSLMKEKKIIHKTPYFAWRVVKKRSPAKKKTRKPKKKK